MNFIHVEPNSHFYTDLKQIEATLQYENFDKDYILIGIQNSISHGYKIIPPESPISRSEQPDYEYEMLFKSEPEQFCKIDGWFPIATDRIRNPEKIEQYIQNGILRKIKK